MRREKKKSSTYIGHGITRKMGRRSRSSYIVCGRTKRGEEGVGEIILDIVERGRGDGIKEIMLDMGELGGGDTM